MDYLLLNGRRGRLLVVSPQLTIAGKDVGYGNLVRHIQEAFQAAHGTGARLCLLPPRRPLNAALFMLVSPDVEVVAPRGLAAWLARIAWHGLVPVRAGGGRAWSSMIAARAARGGAGSLRTLATSLGPRGRALARSSDRIDKWGRRVGAGAQRVMNDRWRSFFRQVTKSSRDRLRKRRLDTVPVALPEAAAAEGRRQAIAAGIDPSRPLVCVHVRESRYPRYDQARRRPLDDRRSARIESYHAAMRRLVDAGVTVVRIGDASMTPVRLAGVVDLATSAARTDLLELWCVLRCRFFIATDSGPYFLSRLIGLPCLATNLLQVGYHIARPHDRFICKRARDLATGRLLPVREMLADDYLVHGLDPDRYAHEDNTPEDLAEAVADMLAVVDGDLGRSPAQRAYDARVAELAARRNRPHGSNTTLAMRRNALGTIARPFADRHYASAEAYARHA